MQIILSVFLSFKCFEFYTKCRDFRNSYFLCRNIFYFINDRRYNLITYQPRSLKTERKSVAALIVYVLFRTALLTGCVINFVAESTNTVKHRICIF